MEEDLETPPQEKPGHNSAGVDIEKYRKLVKSYLSTNSEESALFWAEKVVAMSNGDPRDIYWLAQCMVRCQQYHRAAKLIRNRNLDKKQPLCKWIAAKALLGAKKYSDALLMLLTEEEQKGVTRTHDSIIGTSITSHLTTPPIESDSILEDFTEKKLESAILVLKGHIYEKLDNRIRATECFQHALKKDVFCYEAFQALVQHQMLTATEEKELLESLPISEQCEGPELLPTVYELLLNKYQPSPDLYAPNTLEAHPYLPDSIDMQVAHAEKMYCACAYRECLRLTEEILKKDPYHTNCLPVYIGCLVELKKTTKLFQLAHELVDLMPHKAVSWYAVGCYYFIIGKRDPARRYLGKATSLDKLFGPAWLAYGHSFAAESEHDQAMAAYFSANKLMKGCHLPLLYIGLECGLTNNIQLAERFFLQAQEIAPRDPFVVHEIGIIAFQNNQPEIAKKYFETALNLVHQIDQAILAEKWEPLLNNLGHTHRKLKNYDEALRYHKQALVLLPQNPSTLSSIAFIHALQGNLSEAVDMFHKSLFLRRDDSFSISMLSYAIEQLMDTTLPFPDSETESDVLPQKSSKSKSSKGIKGSKSNPDLSLDSQSMSIADSELSMVNLPSTYQGTPEDMETKTETERSPCPDNTTDSQMREDMNTSSPSFEVEMQDTTQDDDS